MASVKRNAERGPGGGTRPTRRQTIPELDGSIRHWLRAHGYEDVADVIGEIMNEWRKTGVTTRRNWWDILSGDKEGGPRDVAGRKLPVLAAAQRRQGKTVTRNAIKRAKKEELPPTRKKSRWS